MKRLQELREKRNDITKKLVELQETIAKGNRVKTAEERTQFESMCQQRADFDKEIDDLVKMVQIDENAREDRSLLDALAGSKTDRAGKELRAQQGAFQKYLLGGHLTSEERGLLVPGGADMTPEQRAVATTTQDSGGVVGPSTFLNKFIELQKGGQGMWTAPITFIDTPDGNNFILPKITDTSNDATIKAESAAEATNVDPTMANLTLKGYRYTSGVILVTDRMIQNNYLAIEAEIARLSSLRIQRKVNTDATSGDGSSKITGLLDATSGAATGKTAASATAVTIEELIDLMVSVDVAYHGSSSVGFMTSMTNLGSVMKLKDGANQYIFQIGAQGQPDRLLGKPIFINNSVATIATGVRSFAFGDFSAYYLRRIGTPVVKVLRERYADNGQVGIHVHQEFDGILSDTTAVKCLVQA